uniref:Uncharacterized protein n=1 Tax=Anguilla anguilla TaxID=7936 RepID=A0A0E9VMF3_ANGAN
MRQYVQLIVNVAYPTLDPK